MMSSLELEEWKGPFDKPRTTLVEVAYVSGVRYVLRRFDMSEMPQFVQITASDFSIDPPEPSNFDD